MVPCHHHLSPLGRAEEALAFHRPGFFFRRPKQFPPLLPMRRFPPPWTVQRSPGCFKVVDASGQSRAYFYARENDNDAGIAGVLTMDEARRLASNFAKLPELLGHD
jgi:hypothetical protein